MNEFKKIVPKKKEKKRASSAKRNNYLTEKKKTKKPIISERSFTTYEEVFEKLNSKMYKNNKLRANSTSKKKKNSKNKNYLSLEQNKKKFANIFTNNTQYTTFETDNNKRKNKISPKKEEFSNILSKAKELLSIQSDILIQCGKLSKNLTKTDKEIERKLKSELNNNGTNILPGLAKALYLLELKKENNQLNNDNINEKTDKNLITIKNIEEEIEKSFYIRKFNELNGFIGELGYSYVYNEFVIDNYNKDNLIIYFDNIKKLINMLHQTVNSQNEILMKQENQINEYEKYINDYQNNTNKYNNFDIGLITRNTKKDEIGNINDFTQNNNKLNKNHILINENSSFNNIDVFKGNNNINNNNNIDNNNFRDNINTNDFDKIEECKNVFKDNLINNKIETPKNTHYYNSYINQLNYKNKIIENSINTFSDNIYANYNDKKEINKENLPPEKNNNFLNYCNEQNIFSSMIDSKSFFESYKRNKELKHNLNFNYNERNIQK